MILKNSEIYHYYLKLKKVFDSETRFLPAKIIFKNSKPNCWAYGNYNINTEIK